MATTYEQARLLNIQKNKERLKALGLGGNENDDSGLVSVCIQEECDTRLDDAPFPCIEIVGWGRGGPCETPKNREAVPRHQIQ